MTDARRRIKAIEVCRVGVETEHTTVIVHGAIEWDQLVSHTVPGDHLASRLPERREVRIVGADD